MVEALREQEGQREETRGGGARQRIPAAFNWSSHWEVLRFKMVSCDVDCVFDLSFEGFVLFSGGENLARSHFRTANSQQKVGKLKQGIVKTDFSLPPRKNRIFFCFHFFLPCFSAEPAPGLALHIDGLFLIIRLAQTCVFS